MNEISSWTESKTDTLYEEREYEVIAAFYSEVFIKVMHTSNSNFIDAQDEETFDYNIGNIRALALYDTGIETSFGDRFITLITCSYHTENGRFAVVARLKD